MTEKESNQHPYPQNYPPYEDEINLIDYLRVLWKWKIFIILMVILCVGLTMGVVMVKYPIKYVTQCTISLNFPGIEKHKNPDDTLFSKNQIITPAILSKATAFLHKENKTLHVEDVRGMIDIKGAIPLGIQEEMEKAKKSGEPYTYFPNQFSLTLTTNGKEVFLEKERSQILFAIIDEYRKTFEKKYGEEPLVVVNIPDDYLEKYDYPEIVSIFQLKINNVVKFLDSKIKKAGFFRDPKTRLSFADIKDKAEILQSIELVRVAATIDTLKLVKNKENLINQYKYRIKEIEIKEKKKKREAEVAQKLLKEAASPGRYALSKGGGSKENAGSTSLVIDSSFIENLIKNDYYSFLLKKALNAEVEAKNLEVDKEFLKEKIADLRDKGINEKKNREAVADVVKSLETIRKKLLITSQEANELNKEYLKKIISGAIQVIKDPETSSTRSKSLKKVVSLAGVVALFFAIFLAFFIEYIKNATRSTKQAR